MNLEKSDVVPDVVPDVDTATNSLVDSVISNLQSVYTGDISPINAVSIVTTAMQIVEKLPKLKGGQKKALVLTVIHKLAEKADLDKSILAIIPDMIDMAISIQNGIVSISKKTGCFCC